MNKAADVSLNNRKTRTTWYEQIKKAIEEMIWNTSTEQRTSRKDQE